MLTKYIGIGINIQGESFRLREKKKAGLLNFGSKNN